VTSPFLGEIRMFGFNFAPTGWALCDGQLVSISQNTALFNLLGTIYGGDGKTTFALPNLQSRVAIHMGQGTGLSPYEIGQAAGTETVTLTAAEMPVHSHTLHAESTGATTDSPGGHSLAKAKTDVYGKGAGATAMNGKSVGDAGSGQPHTNIQPYLTVNFCIALTGVFPSRS
jgi:microcystin-dependent protein